MSKTWFVRAGRDAVYVDDFLQHSLVAIGWTELGEIAADTPKQSILQLYQKIYPERSNARAQTAVSQVRRFIDEIQVGDTVMTFDRERRLYYLGKITSAYAWDDSKIPGYGQTRKVSWTAQVAKDSLTQTALNTLGAIQTLFLVKDSVAQEVSTQSVPLGEVTEPKRFPKSSAKMTQITQQQEVMAQLIEQSEQTIEERLNRLTWEEMQELVAGILRAMGYRTRVSPKGPDRGVDIFASPDGLGLEEPRIFVEVKHRNQAMSASEIRAFLGGRSIGDKCLYVSTGGFTKDARYEADRAAIAITLLSLVDLRKLLINHYEKVDEEVKALMPLRRIYVTAEQDID